MERPVHWPQFCLPGKPWSRSCGRGRSISVSQGAWPGTRARRPRATGRASQGLSRPHPPTGPARQRPPLTPGPGTLLLTRPAARPVPTLPTPSPGGCSDPRDQSRPPSMKLPSFPAPTLPCKCPYVSKNHFPRQILGWVFTLVLWACPSEDGGLPSAPWGLHGSSGGRCQGSPAAAPRGLERHQDSAPLRWPPALPRPSRPLHGGARGLQQVLTSGCP